MIEAALIETNKVETVIKEETTVTGKIIIDQDTKTLTVIGEAVTLTQLQNNLFRIMSDTDDYIPMPIAGETIFPQEWTIIFKSYE